MYGRGGAAVGAAQPRQLTYIATAL
jgi:hypothetical protein